MQVKEHIETTMKADGDVATGKKVTQRNEYFEGLLNMSDYMLVM